MVPPPIPTDPPSSSSHINAMAVESAFSTPPSGETAKDEKSRRHGTLSPAEERLRHVQRAQSTPPEITHAYQYGTLIKSTDAQLSDVARLEHTWQRMHLSKKKSQYYTDAFAHRESNNSAKERVAKDSIVLAELKMNYCVESEKDFLIDLSFRLSEIYQRPASCIMIMLNTDVTMILSGTSEPAYHLTIVALQSEIAATKNKRSTHLIQDFMQDILEIPPTRGVLRFEAVAEENLATNGLTALQEIEQLERQPVDEDGILRALSRQRSRRSKKASGPILADKVRTAFPSLRANTPSQQQYNILATTNDFTGSTDISGPSRKRVKSRKSILSFFRK